MYSCIEVTGADENDDDKADPVELLVVLIVISARFREICRSSNLANQIFANWAKINDT